MNRPQSSRLLLVEQLESRCLLAAGVLGQMHHHPDQNHGDRHRHSPIAEHRDADPARAPYEQGEPSASDSGHSSHREDRFEGRRSDRGRDRDRGHIERRPRADAVPPLLRLVVAPTSITPVSNPTAPSPSHVSSPPPSSSSSQQRIVLIDIGPDMAGGQAVDGPSRTFVPVNASSPPDQADASQSHGESESPDSEVSRTILSEKNTESFQAIEPTRRQAGENPHITNTDQGYRDFDLRSRPELAEPEQDSTGGMIDTLPMLRGELPATNSESAEQPWELSPRSLHRLRDVTKPDAATSALAPPAITDAVIDSWFGNKTGLIDVHANGRLHEPVAIHDSIVNVVLDATLGVHRSVDLIASATPQLETMPHGLRDAILTVIAAERAAPNLAPFSNDARSTHFSALAYPGTAIVATAVTIAVKRKRGEVKWETTEPRKRPGVS